MTLKFYGWPRKTIGHFVYTHSRFMHHFIAIGEFRFELQSGNAQTGSNLRIFWSRSHRRMSIWGTVRKPTNSVLTSVILTFDLWPLLFAWTSLMSLVITPENFMMIRWQEYSQKCLTDRETDRRTDGRMDWTIHRAAWSQLKNIILHIYTISNNFRMHD